MNKANLQGIGPIVYWKDYIKVTKEEAAFGEEPTIKFEQSNTKLDGFYERTIGILLVDGHEGHYTGKHYYVAVAADNGKTKKKRRRDYPRIIINNRIKQSIKKNEGEILAKERGITVVPVSYLDLLYKDPAVTNNIYGPLDPTLLELALAHFNG